MELTLLANHELKGSGYFIGRSGENKSDILDIVIKDESLLNKWPYIEFENNGNKFSTERLTITDNKISYPIPNGLLNEGEVLVQIVFRDETKIAWKSYIRKFVVGESLCVSDSLPIENPDFITEAQILLNQCENAKNSIVETSEDLTARVEGCEMTCNEIEASEATRQIAEDTRLLNEKTRQTAEDNRTDAEGLRVEAENTRIENEQNRVNNEVLRVEGENVRVANENARIEAENARQEVLNSKANIAQLENELLIRDKLLQNMYAANEGKTYQNVIDSSVAYQKANPSNVLPYATINDVGGMTYKSENLLILNDKAATVENGVTYSISNGAVIASGSILESYFTSLISEVNPKYLVKGKKYTIWSNASGELYLEIKLTDSNGNNYFYNTRKENKTTFVYTEDIVFVSVMLVLGNSIGAEVAGTYLFMLVEGEEIPTKFKAGYEGFRNSVVSSIRSVGKNLFNVENFDLMGGTNASVSKITANSITITTTAEYEGNGYKSTSKSLKDLAPYLVVGKTYVLSAQSQSINKLFYFSNSSAQLSKLVYFGTSFELTEALFNAKISIYGLDTTNNQGTGDCVISNIQIEEGTTATEYEPYCEHVLNIPSEIQALEGYGLGIDATCRNYVDLKNRKYIQRVKKIVLDGTQYGGINATYTNETYVTVTFIIEGAKNYANQTNNFSDNKDITPSQEAIKFAYLNVIYIKLLISRVGGNTFDDVKNYLKSNSITVIYELATPIETDISQYLSDYLIEVNEGGSITFENEYMNDIPSNITYQIKVKE